MIKGDKALNLSDHEPQQLYKNKNNERTHTQLSENNCHWGTALGAEKESLT
jgi:hypothetical protein